MKHNYLLIFLFLFITHLSAQRVQLIEGTYADAEYVAQRNLLYALRPDQDGNGAGGLCAIDPGTGEVLACIGLGDDPYLLRTTTSGDYAYVGFRQSSRVVRVDLASLTVDQDYRLEGDRTRNPAKIYDLLPVRNSDDLLVVASINSGCCEPAYQGVILLNQGSVVSRADAVFGPTSVLTYTADDETLIGYDNVTGGSSLQTISVAGGTLNVGEPIYQFQGNNARIEYGTDGRIYSSAGVITQLQNGVPEQVADLQLYNYLQYYGISSVETDISAERVYYLGYNYEDRLAIAEYSTATSELVGSYELLGRGQYNYGPNYTDLESLGVPNVFAFISGSGVLGLTTLCTSSFVDTLANIPPAYTGNNTICPGESLQLTVPEGVLQDGQTVLWSDGQRGDSIFITEGGIYSYRLTDATGCPGPFSEPFNIVKQDFPDSPPSVQDPQTQFICLGAEVQLIANWFYDDYIEWNTGLRSNTLIVTEPGTYTARGINPFTGCYSETSNPITLEASTDSVPDAPVVVQGMNIDTCTLEPVQLSLQEPAEEYVWTVYGYQYSTESTVILYGNNGSDPIEYSVRTRAASGCVSPLVTGSVRFFPPVPAAVVLYNQGTNTLVATGTSGPILWYRNGVFEAETQSLFYQPRQSGFYSARVRGEACLSAESNLINVEGVTAVTNLEGVVGIDIFPNPTHDKLNIAIDVPELQNRKLHYNLVSVAGSLQRQGTFLATTQATPVSVAGLAPGVYILRLRDGAREVVRQRIVVF